MDGSPWYIYLPHWEPAQGECRGFTAVQDTWLKRSTKFSWDISEVEKIYVTSGTFLPILDSSPPSGIEAARHQWANQHLSLVLREEVATQSAGLDKDLAVPLKQL